VKFFAALLLAFLFMAAPARGQSAGPKVDSRALAQQAKLAFDAGDFVKAAKLLEEAYRIKPWSVYLYNLGRTYQQAGNKAQAVSAYERYLTAEPRSPDAGAVRESIRQLKDEIERDDELQHRATAAQDRAAEEALAATRAREAMERAEHDARGAEERARHRASPWPWIVSGVGLSGVAAGAVFGGLSASAHGRAVSDASASQAEADQSSAQTFAVTANVLLIAGAVVGVVGTVWGVFDLRVALASSLHAHALPGSFVVAGSF
jgi:tetratricopeptide (TPR) repeat protein